MVAFRRVHHAGRFELRARLGGRGRVEEPRGTVQAGGRLPTAEPEQLEAGRGQSILGRGRRQPRHDRVRRSEGPERVCGVFVRGERHPVHREAERRLHECGENHQRGPIRRAEAVFRIRTISVHSGRRHRGRAGARQGFPDRQTERFPGSARRVHVERTVQHHRVRSDRLVSEQADVLHVRFHAWLMDPRRAIR